MDLVLLLCTCIYAIILPPTCFNPYFNGSSTSTNVLDKLEDVYDCSFNPYFNGSSTSTL